ncbi:MAG TPA: GTP 3',8-cyclase MoaA [Bacteroidales bacterium]|nr:radical SAM protein [Bacteroidales bacterium]OQB60248.1 MAG: Cyclic pyranopterin monophosphate synthase [Bacteroidetes bacterium ADurb.Bin145]HOU01865.1 GTP 3',8-cyclase MoaA [Bacteroidales bacterium]HQG63934.1 GTP 3',8-cyclase MoaA [Bacteroidales bacterium]HQK69024.1 GTP 3',8-cyclase MoaA [Bacteroidales bacterium]
MLDRFDRSIDYLRLSVTDRCNLRCIYCMPAEGVPLVRHKDILTYNEIAEFTRIAVGKGITKVRITGGEPLVRKNITILVRMISDIPGIRDLSMTTNGVLLKEHAVDLKEAGLHRVNVSLDSVDEGRFTAITRGGNVKDVIEGIDAAINAGLTPVKINCVIKNSTEEKDALEVTEFCHRKGLEIRYIRQMDLVKGHFYPVDGGDGGRCQSCNRLRLTANGMLKPCLFSDIEIDIRKTGYEKAILEAIQMKPECGIRNLTGSFYNIGG